MSPGGKAVRPLRDLTEVERKVREEQTEVAHASLREKEGELRASVDRMAEIKEAFALTDEGKELEGLKEDAKLLKELIDRLRGDLAVFAHELATGQTFELQTLIPGSEAEAMQPAPPPSKKGKGK